MRQTGKGKLLIHMIIFVLARAVFLEMRPLFAGIAAGAYAAGVGMPGTILALALGMAGTLPFAEFVKYLCILLTCEIMLVLSEKIAGKPLGNVVAGGICAFIHAGVTMGGLLLGVSDISVWQRAVIESVLVFVLAGPCSAGFRFFLGLAHTPSGRNFGKEFYDLFGKNSGKESHGSFGNRNSFGNVLGAAFLLTITIYSLPNVNIWLFYVELAALICLFLLTTDGEENESGRYAKEHYQDMMKKRLGELADSFELVSASFLKLAQSEQTLPQTAINTVLEEISDRVCRNCENCRICWGENYEVTAAAAEEMFTAAMEKGSIEWMDVPASFGSACICMETVLSETNRSLSVEKLKLSHRNQMAESRGAVAGQLKEVAKIVEDCSGELYETMVVSGIREDLILAGMRKKQIGVKKVSVLERGNRGLEVHLYARCKRGRCISVKEAAAVLSRILGRRFVPDAASHGIIGKEYTPLVFKEDTNYRVLTGMARVSKEQGDICGDNFSFLYPDTGELIMMLSDGMGSGEQAEGKSRFVIELLEELLEAGFRENTAVRLINSLLVVQSDERGGSTVDLGVIDLYTGNCGFMKAGAAAAYLKRGEQVEIVEAEDLPPGMIADYTYEEHRKTMENGEFLIMVTDGVADCFPAERKEEALATLIAGIGSHNPQEIANTVLTGALKCQGGVPADDMTVLVAGLWRKT